MNDVSRRLRFNMPGYVARVVGVAVEQAAVGRGRTATRDRYHLATIRQRPGDVRADKFIHAGNQHFIHSRPPCLSTRSPLRFDHP